MKNERTTNSETILLYETDGMCLEFFATVIRSGADEKTGAGYAVFDRTAFFPGGGGQDADKGWMVTEKNEKIKITAVDNNNGVIRHFTDKPPAAGEKVKCIVDNIRLQRMQVHTGEHIVSGLIKKMFGYDNVGFHITGDEAAVFDTEGPLSEKDIQSIEEAANEAVRKNLPVTALFPSAEEAKNMTYRSKLDTFEDIRLVDIKGIDVCACCAPHVTYTGMIGVIKIIDAIPHRGGMRITMIAGKKAYDDYVMLCEQNARVMKTFSAPRDRTAQFVDDFANKYNAQKEEIISLKRALSDIVTKEAKDMIAGLPDDAAAAAVFADALDAAGLRELVNECTKTFDGIVCAFSGKNSDRRYIFGVREDIAEKYDLVAFTKDFNAQLDAKGGGSRIMTQGSCAADKEDIQDFVDKLTKKA